VLRNTNLVILQNSVFSVQYLLITELLIDKARMKKRVTINDVARHSGVSVATVSRVINNYSKVSDRTRKKVKDTIEELGFDPHNSPKLKSQEQANAIGVILGDISNPYFSRLAKNIEETLEKLDYTMFLTDSNYDEEKELRLTRLLLTYNVDGVLISSVDPASKAIELLMTQSIPFIALNCQIDDDHIDWITSNNLEGGYIATKYLLDLGHPRIMHIKGNNAQPAKERYEGFKKAIAEKHLTLKDQIVTGFASTELHGYDIIQNFIKNHGRDILPSAIFAVNDPSAIGAMEALDEHHINIPDDISIVGYDNIQISKFLKVPLTTVDQSEFHMGDIAASQLVDKIRRNTPTVIRRHILIKPELKIRDSCTIYHLP
jgi:LacI family transcriptional regulator